MKTIFITLLLIYLLGLSFFVLYLLFLNRGSEILWAKFLPALAIGLTGAFFFTWYNLKEENIEKKITATYISSNRQLLPLEKMDLRYSLFYGGNISKARCYLKPVNDQTLWEYHLDIAFIEICQNIFQTYQVFKNRPDQDLISSTQYPKALMLKREIMDWDKFSEKLKITNELIELIDLVESGEYTAMSMTIPKGTVIKCTHDMLTRTISLENEFCEVKITVFNSYGSIGLGEFKWLLNYDEVTAKDYFQSFILISFDATFNKFRYGHPDRQKYWEWVQDIFENISNDHNYEKQLSNARENYLLYKDKIDNY